MKQMSYRETKRAEFIPYVEKIKAFGYRVRISNSEYYDYAYVIDEHNVVGCLHKNYFGGVNLSTFHRPNRKYGTGFLVRGMITLDELTKNLVEGCFCVVPQRFGNISAASIKKVIIDDGSDESKRILETTTEF